MTEQRTVFVLGAGASCPYGFPTARGLRAKIIGDFVSAYECLREDRKRLGIEGINEHYPRTIAARDLVARFNVSSTESIDLFLSRHPELQEIGKMAICLSILKAERASFFRESVREPSRDWYFYLFNKLTRTFSGVDGYQEFGKSNMAFVTFNYDRSLEYFLSTSLLNAFQGASPGDVEEQIQQVPIVHVYGRVAPLLLPHVAGGQAGLQYGKHLGDSCSVDFPSVIKNVHIVREERDNPQLEKAREEIRKADRIFFLGFGYADENLEALGFPGVVRKEQTIYGTAMGWTSKEIMTISARFWAALGKARAVGSPQYKVHIRGDCDCVALLREYL